MLKHFVAAAVLTGIAVATPAQPTASWVNARFKAADANGDGQLTRAETARALSRAYPRRGMSAARRQQLLDYWFRAGDRDRSGTVSRSEAHQAATVYSARFDTNRNGRIDASERRAVQAFVRSPA